MFFTLSVQTEIFSSISDANSIRANLDYINVTLPNSMYINGLTLALNNKTNCNETDTGSLMNHINHIIFLIVLITFR